MIRCIVGTGLIARDKLGTASESICMGASSRLAADPAPLTLSLLELADNSRYKRASEAADEMQPARKIPYVPGSAFKRLIDQGLS